MGQRGQLRHNNRPISECEQLREEVARLSHLLTQNGIDPFPPRSKPPNAASAPTEKTKNFSTDQKIELFRSLFRGREDVYAVRWEDPNGRYGYSPASKRDWSVYNAAKPEDRKRVDKETRTYLPLTNQAIHDHLAGKQAIGVYPYSPTKPVGSWPPTLTGTLGRKTQQRSLKAAVH